MTFYSMRETLKDLYQEEGPGMLLLISPFMFLLLLMSFAVAIPGEILAHLLGFRSRGVGPKGPKPR
jgi:hypothetical protein